MISRTHLWWGQAFTQVMHRVQSLLSVSWAGWLCRGQPAVASPSGGSAGPPLRQWYVLQLPASDSKLLADTWQKTAKWFTSPLNVHMQPRGGARCSSPC